MNEDDFNSAWDHKISSGKYYEEEAALGILHLRNLNGYGNRTTVEPMYYLATPSGASSGSLQIVRGYGSLDYGAWECRCESCGRVER